MIDRSNPGLENQVQVSFLLHQEIWHRFETKCLERGITTPEVLIGLVMNFVKPTENSSLSSSKTASLKSLEALIDDYLREKIESYFEQYLKAKIIPLIEDYINLYFEENSEETVNSSLLEEQPDVEVSSSSNGQSLTHSIPSHFKTAKELAKILGVSAPYITTLNRIGELRQRGWEDSGQRRGKTILYQPIHQ